MCRVEQAWTLEELQAEVGALEPGEGGFTARGDSLTFAYRTSRSYTTSVSAIVLGEVPMERVSDSEWWQLTLQFDGIDAALLTFGVIEQSSSGGRFEYPFLTWRGPNAPAKPPEDDPLLGTLDDIRFESEALGSSRAIHVYLPPNYDAARTYPVIYMLDGEGLPAYAGGIDYLISQGVVPPLIIVGVESAPFSANENRRGEEYVAGRSPQRFAQHEQFFTEEVRAWAETTYGASTERAKRAIFGMSNGGLFAVEMTLRHPELYGIAFVFSAGASQDFAPPSITRGQLQLPLRVYSTAGTLDPIFDQATREFARQYADAGAEVVFTERVSGHDEALWRTEFVEAVRWAFGQ